MKPLLLAFVLSTATTLCMAKTPDCTSPDAWPAAMAFAHLKNADLISNESTDFTHVKVSRLASEKTGKNLYHQIHRIRFPQKIGEVVEVITSHDASSEECSMSDVDVYLVSKHLGGKVR